MEIVRTLRANPAPIGGPHVWGPLIHIHKVDRDVHGNGIDIKIYGEMQIAAGSYVYARELKLNTLEVLALTPMIPLNNGLGYMAQQWTTSKGLYDNYASIDIYDDASVWQTPGTGPSDGSVWLSFIAEGE